MPPIITPQTGMKRGPKTVSAAQQNYLSNRAANRPTVTPTPVPAKPNPFSASGTTTAPPASSGVGLSASAPSSIPAASSPGATSTPASLGMTPSASTQMKQGGGVPDPGGAIPADPTDPSDVTDTGQGQAGQAGDLGSIFNAVQQAYQFGLQHITGNIPTVPAGPGGDQTQGGPQDRGNQKIAMDTSGMRPSTNMEDDREAGNIGAVNQPLPKQGSTPGGYTQGGFGSPQTPQQQFPSGGVTPNTGAYPYNQTIQPIQSARGGSAPSYQGGGIAVPSAAPSPQQPAPAPMDGGVQPRTSPPQIMRYLTGADAEPVQSALRRQKMAPDHLPPTAKTAHAVATAGGPQQQYQALQAFRRLSDNAGTHAKVSLAGNGKIPPSLPHAVMFANKKFEYAPSPLQVSFHLKGKGAQPTQGAMRGGLIQAFDDGGNVDPEAQFGDVGMPSTAPASDQNAPITMQVQDLRTGKAVSADLNGSQLGDLLSNTYDNWISQPAAALQNSFKEKLANVKEAFNPHSDYNPPDTEPATNWDLFDALKAAGAAVMGDTSQAGQRFDPRLVQNNVPFPGAYPAKSVTKMPLPALSATPAGGNPNLGYTTPRNPMTGEETPVPVGQDIAHRSQFYRPPEGPTTAAQLAGSPSAGAEPAITEPGGAEQAALQTARLNAATRTTPAAPGQLHNNAEPEPAEITPNDLGRQPSQRGHGRGRGRGRGRRVSAADTETPATTQVAAATTPMQRKYGIGPNNKIGTWQELPNGQALFISPYNLTANA